jgi:hypothetical protein
MQSLCPRKEAFGSAVWFLPAVSRLERHPISCNYTHTRTCRRKERERLRAPHNEGTLSAGSRVTFRSPTALLLHKEFYELWNYSRFMSKGICTWNWNIFCALIRLNRGTQLERKAWSISWYQHRRCPPCNILGKRRRKWLGVFVGVCALLLFRPIVYDTNLYISAGGAHLATVAWQHAWFDRYVIVYCTRPTVKERDNYLYWISIKYSYEVEDDSVYSYIT